ncbi:MAG TPA: efflux transporter outer membrane subunit [Candidatus Krumholzibacteria bacterium]|nr:efflux transporter outer membrane subunit [Candidatus Krumholzibacteria bacterium]HPD71877.1 efflux transporter outer membrane subunit [Candidatus Krumholzibacteria bacterium]HRY41190.1 efflux transporter outer membrane subunit [Candidatus Krumholzibacteria bacterium]
MNRAALSLPLALVIAAAGCTMAPQYLRPAAQVPPAWPEGAAYADSLADLALPAAPGVSPQELYPDPRLRQVVALALANNLDLRLAALNVEKVRAYYKIERADLFPAISVAGSATRHHTPADLSFSGEEMTSEEYSIDVGVASWEIDLFGRVRSEKNRAWEQYLATEAGRRGAELSLVSAVGESYLTLAASRELLQLAKSTLASQQAVYDLGRKQYDAGLATRLDLQRIQTQVNVAEVDVAGYTRMVAQDENALNLLVGAPVPPELLPEDLGSVAPPADVAAGLSSAILLGRPDIMAAEHQLKAANAYIGVARAAFFPRISLTALVGTASAALSGLFAGNSDTWTFSPQASMPLFDLRTQGALRASKADQQIVLAQYQRSIQRAFREVADALAVRGTIGEQVAGQTALVEAAREIYDLAQMRYDKGIDSYLSVLDAQRSLYRAQHGMVALRLAELTNKVQLYAVLGGGSGAVE